MIRKTATLLAASLLAAAPAYAGTVTLTLSPTASLTNVDDAAGRYQYTGGDILLNGVDIGDYWSTKRVTFGATLSNEAPVELVLKMDTALGDGNVTLKGLHSFNSGGGDGGVSATSDAYSILENGKFTYAVLTGTSTTALTLTY